MSNSAEAPYPRVFYVPNTVITELVLMECTCFCCLICSGGLRLKRDITEYGELVRSFNAPSIDEKFELLFIMANVFIVAPESLASLFEGTPSIRKDALRFVQLRDEYKSAKLASRLNSILSES